MNEIPVIPPGSHLCDLLHIIIRRFAEAFPKNFELTGIKPCKRCSGEGINVERNGRITFWQPGNYCQDCGGIGFIGIEEVYGMYVCKQCNGSGCKYCNNKGIVDWITNAMG
jgi:hypothetical protein